MQTLLKRDKKGQIDPTNYGVFNIFTFMILIFIAVLFFGGLIYVTGLLNNVFVQVGLMNEGNSGMAGYTNLTVAAENTFGKMNSSIQALRLVAVTLIFSEILFFVVFVSFKRTHPFMFIAYIFLVFLAVMLAAPISNAYESLMQAGIYNGTLNTFTGSNYVLLNLPLVVLITGILGAILMFINILRTRDEGSL